MKRSLLFFALSLVALAAGSSNAAEQEFKGQMTDGMCGRKHMMKGVSDTECADKCVDAGAKYALFVPADGKMYVVDDQARAKEFAGQNVVAKARVSNDGNTITQSSIAKQK